MLRNIDIPYNTRLSTFDNQNSKTKKPYILPRCRSLAKNFKLSTVDVSAQRPNKRNQFFTLNQTFRQRSP